jgi:hypothetical protein
MRKHFDITVFADQGEDVPTEAETFDLEIPENLSDLADGELTELRSKAVDAFQELYAGGEFSDEDLNTLGSLTDGIEVLSAEISTREQAASERAAKAAELAAKIGADKPADEDAEETPASGDDAPADEDEAKQKAKAAAAEPTPAPAGAPGAVTAAAPRGPIRLSGIRRRTAAPAPAPAEAVEEAPRARLTVADVPGFAADSDASFEDLAVALDRRLQGFNSGAYCAPTAPPPAPVAR